MNNTNFRIRPYSKRELARLYFPDTVNEESAIANLRNLMKHNPPPDRRIERSVL